MFRSIHGSVCFYPSDAVSTERAIELAANYEGITFTRTSRPETSVIYPNEEVFKIGQAKVWGGGAMVWGGGMGRRGKGDGVCITACSQVLVG